MTPIKLILLIHPIWTARSNPLARRLPTAGLLLLLLLLMAPAVAQAQYEYDVTPDKTVTITRYTGKDAEVIIPGTIDDLPVTAIGASAFFRSGHLTSVEIPDSVLSIGSIAFHYCTGLTGVTLPNSDTMIGDSAFANCTSLTNIFIPAGVTNFNFFAFSGCTNLTSLIVDELNPVYTGVDGVAFNKSQTSLIRCPDGRSGSYSVPAGITSIEGGAFASCSNLVSVTIPDSVTSIRGGTFAYCRDLLGVRFPSYLSSIGDGAFYGCISLTNIIIPNCVGDIGDLAFTGSSSLSNVVIGASVTNIGARAFGGCRNLTGIYFQGDAPRTRDLATSDATVLYYLPGTTGWQTLSDYGYKTALWVLPTPVILTTNSSLGVITNAFGFTVSWATNASVVVEAAEDPANPTWAPLGTNTLDGGSFYFSDPGWLGYPNRFYRLRSP